MTERPTAEDVPDLIRWNNTPDEEGRYAPRPLTHEELVESNRQARASRDVAWGRVAELEDEVRRLRGDGCGCASPLECSGASDCEGRR